MRRKEVQEYYSRPEIRKAILNSAEGREVVPVFRKGKFGKRPSAVQYEKDLEQLVKKGAVTFYGSLERWKNPFSLKKELNKAQLDRLRTGWDLVLDIDSKDSLEPAKKTALALIKTLESYGVNSYSLKFSGRRGFHVTLPFKIFPPEWKYEPAEKSYPELPRLILDYLTESVRPELEKEFGKKLEKVLEIDSAVIASRHLIRLPYCLHQKTWLSSIYLSKEELENFKKKDAEPGNFNVSAPDLSPQKPEADDLVQSAELWDRGRKKPKKKSRPDFSIQKKKSNNKTAPVQNFPPCIKNILSGLKDGRKRSVFLLTTFLHHAGWDRTDIEKLLLKWNERNEPPLEKKYIDQTIRSQFKREEPQMA
ncbi:MAG: hypothetical protein R6U26_01065, partial [Candidatus Undinarchaeales archaeon]